MDPAKKQILLLTVRQDQLACLQPSCIWGVQSSESTPKHMIFHSKAFHSKGCVLQSQDGCFRPPSRRLSRPSTAQRSGGRPMLGHALHAFHPPAAGSQAHAGSQHNQGLQIRGGRKVQSARPSERVSALYASYTFRAILLMQLVHCPFCRK